VNQIVKARVFWLVSLTLALSAISLHIGALGAASEHVNLFTRAMNAPESQKQELKAEAKHFSKKSDALVISGWVTAAVGLISLFISHRREEFAPRSVVVVLLAFYVLLQFAVV
jgi:uncharacterized membrane protein